MGDCACDVRVDQLDPSAPLTHFFLELTPECNNHCPGCGSAYAHTRRGPLHSAAEWRAIVDRLPRVDLRLRLTGGEPFLYPAFEEVAGYVDALGIPFTVFTNARWHDPAATIHFLAMREHLEGILVSIHGARAADHEVFTATPGSFDEAVENARRAAEAGIRVVSSTVITHQNYRDIDAIVALVQEIGVDQATFSRFIGLPLPQIEATDEELKVAVADIEHLIDSLGHSPGHGHGQRDEAIRYGAPIPHCFVANRSNGCMAGFVHATVDPWGNLRPCPHMDEIAGNLFTQDFDEVWHGPVLETWRAQLLAQCDSCRLADTCRSGCLAQARWRGSEVDPLIC